jgi:hypothetical protein
MAGMLRLEPPLWLHTPRGAARAFFLIDAGVDMDLMWVCFQHDAPYAGECWTYSNWDIRIMSNKTMGMLTESPWENRNGMVAPVGVSTSKRTASTNPTNPAKNATDGKPHAKRRSTIGKRPVPKSR